MYFFKEYSLYIQYICGLQDSSHKYRLFRSFCSPLSCKTEWIILQQYAMRISKLYVPCEFKIDIKKKERIRIPCMRLVCAYIFENELELKQNLIPIMPGNYQHTIRTAPLSDDTNCATLRMLKPNMHAPQAWSKSTSDWDMGPTPTWTIIAKTWEKD